MIYKGGPGVVSITQNPTHSDPYHVYGRKAQKGTIDHKNCDMRNLSLSNELGQKKLRRKNSDMRKSMPTKGMTLCRYFGGWRIMPPASGH